MMKTEHENISSFVSIILSYLQLNTGKVYFVIIL